MADKIVNILNAITNAKGESFAEGFVTGINLSTPDKKNQESDNRPG